MAENLLKSRRFLPLLLTQFLGALNDNLFKNALLMLVTVRLVEKADILSNVIAALFIIPFFLFSATAGEVSDKYDRSRVARILKVIELILMLGVGGIYLFQNLPCLIILLALMGAQSAFFGPVKYSLLPQQLKPDELVAGNAYVEASTYIAILLGLIVGTLLPIESVILLLITLAAAGVISAWNIPLATPMRPKAVISKNIFKATKETLSLIHRNKIVFRSILGATWFWTIGAFIAVQIYPLSRKILYADKTVITFFLILFSIGVALGSLVCEKIMKEVIHTTYIPLCVLAIGICFYALYALTNVYPSFDTEIDIFNFFFDRPHAIGISLSLFLLAFFGGLYIVPLNALMQSKAPKAYTATVIGGNNILNAAGMASISILAVILLSTGFTIPQLFLLVAVGSIGVFFYICKLLPDALLRSILQGIFGLFFRVRLEGIQNFKKAGNRVLLVANHTSLLDGLLIATFMPDRVTFAINTDWSKKWFMKPFGLLVDLYPLDPTNPMAIRSLINEVKKNKKVMIFPEGRISVTGGLMKVYEGAGVVAQKANAKIVPVRINGAQFSKFSYLKNKLKTRAFPKISLTILSPRKFTIPEGITGRDQRHYISMQLYDLMADMMYETSNINEHLFASLLKSADLYGWNQKIAEDISRKPLTYNALVKKSYVLGQAYKSTLKEEYVALMLPNGLANVVSFFALQSVDKVPVMLNFSQGIQQILSCIKTVEVKTVITSKLFIRLAHLEEVEKAILESGTKIIYLERFAKKISLADKVKGFSHHLSEKKPKHSADKPAVVLFTSGSEGMPKAVLLSHKNLQANRYQITSIMAFNSSDVFFNALPMFHSFGLSVGTIIPILSGIKTFFYPSPLHYRIVPELVYDTNATIVCGTDTFFFGYGRMGHPYDFFNLKYAVVGGEKLKETTADLWMKKFGVRILEGYGSTETAPVLALNTPMNVKFGTVGRFVPHINYKIKSVEGVENGGQLWVQGDNIMLGYMKADKPGKLQPAKDHWYDTGDIVNIDSDGFISIQGRAKRFAKIAGEMVSLTSVEQAVDQLYSGAIQGILTEPDEKKGEQLILVTNHEKPSVPELRKFFKEKGFSELWIPKNVIYMKNPPVLGTGKFDYQSAKKMLDNGK
ncbi:MAG: acyl-[ACP]--phospholipid O-acyltransferase [Alphaproteobacteria bacterium]|nr:acyl-[ACP]--phospholipid O-acyltransferase [Alphaproteobacteria bacterium]